MAQKTVDVAMRPELQRFVLHEKSFKTDRRDKVRAPAGGKVWPTGTMEVNVAGTALFSGVAQDEKLTVYGIVFGGDEKAMQVAAIVVDPETAGATPVRYNPKKKTMTVYMNDLFDDNPELCPPSARWCTIDKKSDGAGGHYILIHLSQGLARRSTRRTPETAPPAAQP